MRQELRLDNRLCKRFDVKDCMIALGSVQGHIIDISFAGLSFRYKATDASVESTTEYGAIFDGNGLFFDRIRLRNVSDVALHDEVDDSGAGYRRRGMAFGALTLPDFTVLARVIRQHALSM
ncbi:MAG: hypothetical protein OEY01_05360 [Desulfobulbaceae bacterium]|nr:hypothetical protein [Desulfobulbaceae bacterium]